MADRPFALVRSGGPGNGTEPLGECVLTQTGDQPAADDVVTCDIAGMGRWSSTWGELAAVLDGPPPGFTLLARPDPRDPAPAAEPDDGEDAPAG